jgi:hypothetical protein
MTPVSQFEPNQVQCSQEHLRANSSSVHDGGMSAISDSIMAAYIKAADAIREAFDCALVIIHHCGVDGTRPRGHTSLTGAADAQIAVSRDEATDHVVSKVDWMKDGNRRRHHR